MTLEEAWALSVSGVAVRGNPAMQDIVWPKDSPHPFAFVRDGYKPMPDKAELWRSGEWLPLHPAQAPPDK